MKEEYITIIEKLSDPNLNGRVPGTEGHHTARQLIISQFEKLGLKPVMNSGWEQTFETPFDITGRNLLALKEGKSEKWLLLAAHYDHIEGCPGADDNAAAIGILLSMFEQLNNYDTELNIVLAIFDMEEPPYFQSESMGSVHFYNHLPQSLDINELKGAIVLDLCGHDVAINERENSLFVVGADSSNMLMNCINSIDNTTHNLQTYQLKGRQLFHLSDHFIFDMNNKPHLFLTCGHWPHYHTIEDTFDKLNLNKISNISAYLLELVREIDSNYNNDGSPVENFNEIERENLSKFLNNTIDENVNIEHLIRSLMYGLTKSKN